MLWIDRVRLKWGAQLGMRTGRRMVDWPTNDQNMPGSRWPQVAPVEAPLFRMHSGIDRWNLPCQKATRLKGWRPVHAAPSGFNGIVSSALYAFNPASRHG